MPKLRLAALALGLALAVPPCPAEAELLAEKRDWSWVESPNFRLLTDGATRAGVDVVEELERFRSVVAQLLPKLELNSSRPTYVFLFRDDRGFTPYKPKAANGKPMNLGGLFWWSSDANYILMPSTRHEEFFSTVYHEYFHYLVAANRGELPVWVNEGLAEFYSTFRFRARDGAVDIGRMVEQHVQFLAQYSGLPVETLLAVRHDSPEYNENARRGAFYAQAWLVTHWLLRGESAPAGALARFLNSSANPAGPVAALERATGLPLARIEDELTRYRQRKSFSYRIFPVAEMPPVPKPAVRAARPEEPIALLAGFLGFDEDRHAEAAEHVAAVERLAPGSPLALEARSRLERPRDGVWTVVTQEAAAETIAEPEVKTEPGTESPVRYPLRRAEGLLAVIQPGAPDPAALARAIEAARTAVDAEPGQPAGWRLLIRAVALEGDGARTLALVDEAAGRFPDELDFRLEAARRRAESGHRDQAMAEAAAVRDRAREESLRLEATRLHASLLAERVTELGNREAWDEAERLLSAEIAAAPTPVDGQLAGLLEWVRGVRDQKRQIAAYDRAMALVEEGRYAECVAALRKLLAEGAGPTEEMARQMLRQLESYLARKSGSGGSRPPGS